MKGLKNKMAVGVRIVVILTVILLGTSIVAYAQSPGTVIGDIGEFGVKEAHQMTPTITLSHATQDIVSLTVTPRISGNLLLFAGVAILGMQMGTAPDASAAAVVQLGITQSTNPSEPPATGSGTVNALSIGATPAGAAFLGVPVSWMHVAHVASHATYTFNVTATMIQPTVTAEPPATGGASTISGASLRAILLPTEAVTIKKVDCGTDGVGALQTAINGASPGDTISVTGTCNENVVIREKDWITLDGGGSATINGPDTSSSTLSIRGRGITIKRFRITGGNHGVDILRGGTALVDNNTIENAENHGVVVDQESFARVINCTIQYNTRHGIHVNENSSARIGVLSGSDTVPSPNIIQNNGQNGINVSRSSTARIVGNTISSNVGNGVRVDKVSQADVSDNTIDGNGENGIFVSHNSGVNLGSDRGITIFDLPNTTIVLNGDKGLRCSIGGYMDGRRGTLNGARGRVGHDDTCIDSLVR